jgi:hypothetical protein
MDYTNAECTLQWRSVSVGMAVSPGELPIPTPFGGLNYIGG